MYCTVLSVGYCPGGGDMTMYMHCTGHTKRNCSQTDYTNCSSMVLKNISNLVIYHIMKWCWFAVVISDVPKTDFVSYLLLQAVVSSVSTHPASN